MSVNRVTLLGNLGGKPELKFLESGKAVCTFTVATNERWTDNNNEKQERTEWHRIVTWGKLAENCGQYLDKGRQVYIEGRLQTRNWEEDGKKRFMTEIVAAGVQFLGGAGKDSEKGAQKPNGRKDHSSAPDLTDDIPF